MMATNPTAIGLGRHLRNEELLNFPPPYTHGPPVSDSYVIAENANFDSSVKNLAERHRECVWRRNAAAVLTLAIVLFVVILTVPALTTPISQLSDENEKMIPVDVDSALHFSGSELPSDTLEMFSLTMTSEADINATISALSTLLSVEFEQIVSSSSKVEISVVSGTELPIPVSKNFAKLILSGDTRISELGIETVLIDQIKYNVCPVGYAGSKCDECVSSSKGDLCRRQHTTTTTLALLPLVLPESENLTSVVPEPLSDNNDTESNPLPTLVVLTAAPSQRPLPQMLFVANVVNATNTTFSGVVSAQPLDIAVKLSGTLRLTFRVPRGSEVNFISILPNFSVADFENIDANETAVSIVQELGTDMFDAIDVSFNATTTYNAHDARITDMQLVRIDEHSDT